MLAEEERFTFTKFGGLSIDYGIHPQKYVSGWFLTSHKCTCLVRFGYIMFD